MLTLLLNNYIERQIYGANGGLNVPVNKWLNVPVNNYTEKPFDHVFVGTVEQTNERFKMYLLVIHFDKLTIIII